MSDVAEKRIVKILYAGNILSAKVNVTRTGHVYRGKPYNDYVQAIKDCFGVGSWRETSGYPKGKGSWFGIEAEISYKPRPRGGRVGDIDNLFKPIMDAGIGIIYEDDSQVIEAIININRNAQWEGFTAMFYEKFL